MSKFWYIINLIHHDPFWQMYAMAIAVTLYLVCLFLLGKKFFGTSLVFGWGAGLYWAITAI